MTNNNNNNNDRLIKKFDCSQQTFALFALTYGHEIPLDFSVTQDNQLEVTVNEQIPPSLVNKAKQTCLTNYDRYVSSCCSQNTSE